MIAIQKAVQNTSKIMPTRSMTRRRRPRAGRITKKRYGSRRTKSSTGGFKSRSQGLPAGIVLHKYVLRNGVSNASTINNQGYFTLNPDYQLVTSAMLTAAKGSALAANDPSLRIFVCDIKHHMEIVNNSNIWVKVDMYLAYARKDIWDIDDIPNTAFNTGVSDNKEVSTNNGQSFGITPYNSPTYCAKYKIMRKKTFWMPPGNDCKPKIMTHTQRFHKIYPSSAFYDTAGTTQLYTPEGWYHHLFIYRSQPQANAATTATIQAVSISVLHHSTVTYGFGAQAASLKTNVQTISGFNTGTPLTMAKPVYITGTAVGVAASYASGSTH